MRFLVGIGALNFENASKNRKNLRKILIAIPTAKRCLSAHVENSTIAASSAPTTVAPCVEGDSLKSNFMAMLKFLYKSIKIHIL